MYSNYIPLDKKITSNVMGKYPLLTSFSYNHYVISMQHKVDGILNINGEDVDFHNSNGYIEKDFGNLLPTSHVWCQTNTFQNNDAKLFFLIADVPSKFLGSTRFNCSFIYNGEQYNFKSFNNDILEITEDNKSTFHYVFKKNNLILSIVFNDILDLNKIISIKGKLEKNTLSSINAKINVTLKRDDKLIFSDTSFNTGIDIVK